MIEFGIAVALVVSLITILNFLKKRKKCSSCCSSKETPKNESKAPEQVKQQPETKLDKPAVNAEPTSVNPPIPDATVVTPTEPKPVDKPIVNIEPVTKPQVKEAAVSPTENTDTDFLPQDSILKRHYLTHVCAMIESLAPPRPTDSVLCRHYDAIIVTEIDQCLSDKKAMDQLIHDYENRKQHRLD